MKQKIQCDQCHKWFYEDEIYYGPDPYMEEICDDQTEHWICDDCFQESVDKI